SIPLVCIVGSALARDVAAQGRTAYTATVRPVVRNEKLWLEKPGRKPLLLAAGEDSQQGVSRDYPPALQPNQRGVAFVRYVLAATNTVYSLHYVRLDGSGERSLLSGEDMEEMWNGDGGRIRWAPDGRAVLLQARVFTLGSGESMAERRTNGRKLWLSWLVGLNGRRRLLGKSSQRPSYLWRRTSAGYQPVLGG
ncbi:MAG TPA: hypothetical protein VK689_03790, partial [Armatimonadota bacterium]|nr:hypothetical protein [Armatimonadota bacterium]